MSRNKGTLASIAAELGVSRTTVSNAYNRPDQLSDELREKILYTAQTLGYAGPDPMARSLRMRHVGSIGVVLTEHLSHAFEDHASIDFLTGLAESCYGTQNSLTLIPVGPGGDSANHAMLAGAVVDGFIVYSVGEDDEHLHTALGRGLPTVVCDQPYTGKRYVGIDDSEAIKPTARALIDAGHTRVGILAKRLFRTRLDGFVAAEQVQGADFHVQRGRVLGALEEFGSAGITGVPVVTRHFNDYATAVDAARELLTAHPDLTAVLCTTDSMAFGVLDYCEAEGIDVPSQLSVTGFDGVEMALARGLTTVLQPNKKKGATAGKLLCKLISARANGDPEPGDRIVLPTRFSPGRTVAPPREQ